MSIAPAPVLHEGDRDRLAACQVADRASGLANRARVVLQAAC